MSIKFANEIRYIALLKKHDLQWLKIVLVMNMAKICQKTVIWGLAIGKGFCLKVQRE